MGFPKGSVVKNPPANAGDAGEVGSIPGSRKSPEGEMATHSSILAWRIPWTKDSGELKSLGSQRSDAAEDRCVSIRLKYTSKWGRRSQDGGGVGWGEHFLPHKFINRAFKRPVNSTKQLLNAGRGH